MTTRADWLLLANAMLGQFITGFAARSFVVGLPTIAGALDADIVTISWAVIAYQLAGISLAVVFGRLGDLHGRHAIYGGGFAIMAATALACGVAPSAGWLVGLRLVQGVGAAMIASATRVLAMEAMPEGAAGRAHGFMTMSFHGGVLLGPPVGGVLIDLASWRWVFFVLVPIGVLGVVLTGLGRRRAPAVVPAAPAGAVDYVGAGLLVLLTVVLTALLDRRATDLLGGGRPGAIVALFAAVLVGFVLHERRAASPVVNLALFRIRMFSFSAVSLLVVSTTGSVLMLLLPFYMQDILHQSPSFMGVIFLAAPIFTITMAPVVGRLTDRVGPRIPTSIGVTLTTLALLVGASLRTDSSWTRPAVLMALAGLGQAFFNTANQTAFVGSVPREYRGFATGMVQMVFGLGALFGTSLGTALLTLMFRYASGQPAAAPSPEEPGAFVFAVTGACLACLPLAAIAFVTSLMRGGAPASTR